MEAMYFAVGVLTMVLVAVSALAIYSTVMVLKLKKRTEEMLRDIQNEATNIYRHINEIENNLRTEMRLGEQELNLRQDQLNEHIDQLERATDRRFDKLIDTYLLVKETEKAEKESKKLIKG
jgi:membrane-associated HD superfamily phosphohydrolase